MCDASNATGSVNPAADGPKAPHNTLDAVDEYIRLNWLKNVLI